MPWLALLDIVHRLFDVADALLQPFQKFALKAL
jgi:hypothetical protein